MNRTASVPHLTVVIVTAHTAEVRGPGVYRVLERLACPKQYQHGPPSGDGPCWLIPARFAVEIEALAERLGGRAHVDGQAAMFR